MNNLTLEQAKALYTVTMKDTEVYLAAYKGEERDVVVPATVEGVPVVRLSDNVFWKRDITSVTVPAGVRLIGDLAFCDCDHLHTITLPDTVEKIGAGAMSSNPSLRHVTIPDSVKSIGDACFQCCEQLTTVRLPAGLKAIPFQAFDRCEQLTEIDIPQTVTKIEYGAFTQCKSLRSLVIPQKVKSIGDWAFSECESLQDITMPAALAELGTGVFSRMPSLQILRWPGGAPKLDITIRQRDLELSPCTSVSAVLYFLSDGKLNDKLEKKLRTAMVKNETAIWDAIVEDDRVAFVNAFLGMHKPFPLKSLDQMIEQANRKQRHDIVALLLEYKRNTYSEQQLEQKYEQMAAKELEGAEPTLAEWRKIFGIGIKEGQAEIIRYKGTDPAVVIPAQVAGKPVTSIRDQAFEGSNIESVTIPDSVTTIGNSAFVRCRHLSSVTLSAGLTAIATFAFCNCTALREITIPEGVTAIGYNAFFNCTALESIHLPETIIRIDDDAFWNFPNLAIHAFRNCPNVTIHAPAGSYAETYAKENNIPFVAE